ncbi:MAG: type II toxin-antitoxin system VapC family toxin [Dyadobacter sp.]|uniref:type II toxin-antitoxin system VapC family toxin n=1 Tax=Dyadobacter sp. TaxID=1914288 RepID=UPI0032649886
MNLLFDTNIIIHVVRAVDTTDIIRFLNPLNAPVYTSIVSVAEIKSVALQNKWGANRLNILNHFLDQVNIIDINNLNVNIYTAIDAYSQKKNPDFLTYPFDSPRNMGKNDLWIASLAALLGLQLITTDSDFDHLNDTFFDVRKIDHQDFLAFFKK